MATSLASSLQAVIVVNDSFADAQLAKTGSLDTPWYTSSSSSALNQGAMVANHLDMITGTSGRGIHTIFPAQTLSNVGDTLTATYTFTTPATISASGSNNSALRVGLFDSLGQAGLAANVSASSGTPNALYGLGSASTQPLPGYMLDMDVHPSSAPNAAADLNFREHTQGLGGTGRLMSTTSNFSSFSSGPDAGYSWAAGTSYTGSILIELISATEFELTGTLGGDSYTITDTFDSATFDMLAFHTNSNKFGSSSSAGAADNGLDFTNVTIEFTTTAVPEPSAFLCVGLVAGLVGMATRRR